MDCVNHTGVNAEAYCQNCGKPLCAQCVRKGYAGHVLCEPCLQVWQSYQQPFVPPAPGVPSPAVAATLGFIPGVGAMYNGQFVKGLIHVVIFAVLVSAAHLYGIFGLFVFAWIAYQVFEAFYTAKARRDGTPLPDPLGLNELGSILNPGGQNPGPPPPPASDAPAGGAAQGPSYQAPFTPPPPYGAPYPPPPGAPPIPPIPPVPPPPAWDWRRREPIGAIVLIVLGVLFALGQMDIFSDHIFEYSWPFLLIGLGIWLIVRRVGDLRGGK